MSKMIAVDAEKTHAGSLAYLWQSYISSGPPEIQSKAQDIYAAVVGIILAHRGGPVSWDDLAALDRARAVVVARLNESEVPYEWAAGEAIEGLGAHPRVVRPERCAADEDL